MAEISSGLNSFFSPLYRTLANGLSPSLLITSYEKCFMSDWTEESEKRRPISLLASKTVLVGLIATWFLAASPIRRSESVKAT
ncbi:unnamed protein product [Chondrus crispus]|uniref:Uncharacterized protein n=1 Tax=Chondrus crispus TaxID=2769 RepID=R7Q227_CHOCR|nr:unnamed protein product [Chondrus crispus]CDF32642.1 unnamed protein product [Chondrus crispus]|eukprot:XP_005712414.1 unnamed protein product [Chondrus crispus]